MVMQSLRNGIVSSAVFTLGQFAYSCDAVKQLPNNITDYIFSKETPFFKELWEGLGVMKTQWITTCSAKDIYDEKVIASVEGTSCQGANWLNAAGEPALFYNNWCSPLSWHLPKISDYSVQPTCSYPNEPDFSTAVNWVEDTDGLWYQMKNSMEGNEYLNNVVIGFADFANQSPDSLEGMLIAILAKMVFQHVTNEHFKDSGLLGKGVQLVMVNTLGIVLANACGYEANLGAFIGCDLVSNIALSFI